MSQPDNTVTFITGNQGKADYLARLLGIPIERHKLNLDELQSVSLNEIVEHKVKQGYELLHKPVLVEDVSLRFHALGALPGPFIKFFIDSPGGDEKLCRMLDGFDNRAATAECVFGYYDGKRLELLRGSMDSTIANSPRGDGGFGWDRIFCPDGYGGKTRAELSPEDDTATYTTIKPFAALREFLTSL